MQHSDTHTWSHTEEGQLSKGEKTTWCWKMEILELVEQAHLSVHWAIRKGQRTQNRTLGWLVTPDASYYITVGGGGVKKRGGLFKSSCEGFNNPMTLWSPFCYSWGKWVIEMLRTLPQWLLSGWLKFKPLHFSSRAHALSSTLLPLKGEVLKAFRW